MLTMLMANSCACELIVTESLSNRSAITDEDLMIKRIIRARATGEHDFDQIMATSELDTSSNLSSLYRLLRPIKSIDLTLRRAKIAN